MNERGRKEDGRIDRSADGHRSWVHDKETPAKPGNRLVS